METHHNTMTTETLMEDFHQLLDKWVLWAHLPNNSSWTFESYIPVSTFTTVENTIAVTEILPSILVENCMLFVMRNGVTPMWEDKKNRDGGCFSYKVTNKYVHKVYAIVGETISKNNNFVNTVTGITISPKKHFCIIKIWMSNCKFQDPNVVINDIKWLIPKGCLFKKHTPEF